MATKKAAPKRASAHRGLHLVSPLMHGPDVEALQAALKKGMEHHKIDWLPLSVDGKFGPQTVHAARFYSWVLGLGKGHREPIQKRHTVTAATQKLIRNPEKRSKVERARAKRRQPRLAKIRKAQSEGPAAAVAGARACIGITESPAGSNTGPDRTITVLGKRVVVGVSAFQKRWGLAGVYWCLCFACFWLAWAGAKISGNVAYSVAIEEYARAHTNGFVQVRYEDRLPGDLMIWKFDGPNSPSDHGEMYVGDDQDVGGNTSPEDGDQANGGGVFPKTLGSDTRPLSELSMVVRPLYS